MATATSTAPRATSYSGDKSAMKILIPYAIMIGAQLPMLGLFFRQMWGKAHYQFFPFAILATVVFAWLRWPRGEAMPFHRSTASNLMLIVGLVLAIGSFLFVDPRFTGASVIALVISLLARTVDTETRKSLWPAAIPLLVLLPLPGHGNFNGDLQLITRLQSSSAWFTSRLLDLLGLGHYLSGNQILVPGTDGYGVAEACSGVQSFFTLLFVTSVLIVFWRRYSATAASGVVLGFLSLVVYLVSLALPGFGLAYVAIGLLLWSFLGFRAAFLVASAVFWALLINTLRILLIPYLDVNFEIDLAHGLAHDLLGWGVLAIGVLLLLSTDQLLLFAFGPVDTEVGESGPMGRLVTRFWNRSISGDTSESESGRKRRKRDRRPPTKAGRGLIWAVAIMLAIGGAVQLLDVQQSYAKSDLTVRFFDTNVTKPFEAGDMPAKIDNWEVIEDGYQLSTRERGSDLGKRSDAWQFKAPRCYAYASLDQPFPGWHELTTCYRSSGWNLVYRNRITPEPGDPGLPTWDYIEAGFEKETGEKGYLVFSLFDGSGEGVEAPVEWGGLRKFYERAKNRLSNRWRSSLFNAEAYQTQVWIQHYKDLEPDLKDEIKNRYLKIREEMRKKFLEKPSEA